MNIWKVKIWLSQERKELSKWNKKIFFLVSQVLTFRQTKQTIKNVADTAFKNVGLISVYSVLKSNKQNVRKRSYE